MSESEEQLSAQETAPEFNASITSRPNVGRGHLERRIAETRRECTPMPVIEEIKNTRKTDKPTPRRDLKAMRHVAEAQFVDHHSTEKYHDKLATIL